MNLSPLIISLKVAVTATFFTFFLGIFAARSVIKSRRFRMVLDGIFTLPMVLPPTVAGFFLLLIFGKNGLLGKTLAAVGASVVFTWQGAVIAAVVVSFPLMYRTVRGAFEQMDTNLIDAGRTLGMSETLIFWRVVMPNSWPGIVSGTVLTFARALGEFGATSMLAGNIPGKTQTMSLAVYSAVAGNNREKAYVWVTVITIMSFAAMFIMNLLTSFQAKKGGGA